MSDESISKSRLKQFGRVCIIDGEANPERLERHCVGGIEVTLCQRCYRELLERSAPRSSPIWTPSDDLESIGRALLAEADLLSMLAQSRWVFGHALIDRVRKEAPDDNEDGT